MPSLGGAAHPPEGSGTGPRPRSFVGVYRDSDGFTAYVNFGGCLHAVGGRCAALRGDAVLAPARRAPHRRAHGPDTPPPPAPPPSPLPQVH